MNYWKQAKTRCTRYNYQVLLTAKQDNGQEKKTETGKTNTMIFDFITRRMAQGGRTDQIQREHTDRLVILLVPDVLQDRYEVFQVVSVHRADVVVPELLEQSSTGHHACAAPHRTSNSHRQHTKDRTAT